MLIFCNRFFPPFLNAIRAINNHRGEPPLIALHVRNSGIDVDLLHRRTRGEAGTPLDVGFDGVAFSSVAAWLISTL